MRAIKAAAALMAVAVILIGPPWLLIQIGWPLPDHIPTLEEIRATVTRPPSDLLVLNTLALLGWGLWAALIRALAVELWVQTRTGPRTTGTETTADRGPLRWIAAVLIAAIITTGPATAVATPAEAGHITVATQNEPATEQQTYLTASITTSETNLQHAQQEDPNEVVHTVEKDDTLWDLAAKHLDDPLRYPEIFETNKGISQVDGGTLEDPDLIRIGWELRIHLNSASANDREATPQETPPIEEEEPTATTGTGDEPTEPSESESPSPSGNTETTAPPLEDDGLAPAPPERPLPTGSSSYAPEPTPTDRAEAYTSDAVADPASNSSPIGLWITAGTFLGLGVAFSLLVLAKRRHNRAAPRDDGNTDTLTGRLADLEALVDDGIEPQGLDTVLPLATTDMPEPGEASIIDRAAGGIGITGPGAPAAIRAAILAASASHVPIVITREIAEAIGLDPVEPPPHLTITADLAEAIDIAEARTEDPVFDLAAGRADLPPLILITEPPGPRTDRLTEVLAHGLIGALILGPWENAQISVAPDGTVIAHDPPEAGLEDLSRCYIADEATFAELLTATDDPSEPDQETESTNSPENEEPEHNTEPQKTTAPNRPEPAAVTEATTENAGLLRLTLFGKPTLTWNDQPIRWRRRRSLQLLTALALEPAGRSLDDLLETVVGDSRIDKARGHLGTITSDTRRDVKDFTGLDIRVIIHDDETDRYRLHEVLTVDLHEFNQQRHLAATTDNDTDRRTHLEAALRLYSGDLAAGMAEDWLDDSRAEYKRTAYTTCLHLAALHRDVDNLPAAIEVLERATAIDRARSDAWAALAETHTATGDEAAAEKTRHQLRLWAVPAHNTTPM